jgi:hypothetical protein
VFDILSEEEIKVACRKFISKLGLSFTERVERKIGENIEKSIDTNPKDVMEKMLEDIHMRLIQPFEMMININNYLSEVYEINNFNLVLDEEEIFSIEDKENEIKDFLDSFYKIVQELGMQERFFKSKEYRWWK